MLFSFLFSIEKQKFLNIVRFGVVNSMHPDVQKIAAQNLSNNQPPSPTKLSDQMKALLADKKIYEKENENLMKEPTAQSTITQDMIRDRKRLIASINESVARLTHEHNSEFHCMANVMGNARVVCSTLSSSINLKQYVQSVQFWSIVKNVLLFASFADTSRSLTFVWLMKHHNAPNLGLLCHFNTIFRR